MIELKSADHFTMKDRGLVFTFHGVEGLNPRTLVNQDVSIDGRVWHVRSAETYAVIDPTGFNFGLLVEPRDGAADK